eukprot:TRINITY_DN3912_c0_g1_i2.p1 TRINITY_DN3912_c0_g1~~TRINITY_DN3912_c0_g1_i2.p1  ORF type:complete len:319 (-),score=106.71 TRINITY_DN3912_c0_g1_i2:70-1026(-)
MESTPKFSSEDIKKIKERMLSKDTNLAAKFRGVFTLKNLGGNESVDALVEILNNEQSNLLKHEIAYVLGQMQNTYAVPFLSKVLANEKENSMVRHEAGESLGALGTEECLEILEKFKNDPVPEVSETCILAIDRIKWLKESKPEKVKSKFDTVDPAPSSELKSIEKLEEILLNENLTMFERYKALFKLRDIAQDESDNDERVKGSVLAICKGLKDKSALFRHEMAYVLGQIHHPYATDSLRESLEIDTEHEMVRHESAEALGAIATEDTYSVLHKYSKDSVDVVRESCEVALDVYEYVNNDEQFQYCDTLISLQKEDN